MPAQEGKAVDGFVVHEVMPDVAVRATRTMPDMPAPLEQEVERLWRAAAERVADGGAGRMFNGRVFTADAINPALITGHLTEYRRVVAQMERPALFAELGVRPLAVCGVLRCADGLVVGRRHPAAIYEPGMWQLPPAGSVDAGAQTADGRLDLRRQLLDELLEELGLPPAAVDRPRPLCIVEHPDSHVSDFGMALITHLSGEQVLAAHRAAGNAEYQQMLVVSDERLPGFLAAVGETIVPPALEFLRRVGDVSF